MFFCYAEIIINFLDPSVVILPQDPCFARCYLVPHKNYMDKITADGQVHLYIYIFIYIICTNTHIVWHNLTLFGPVDTAAGPVPPWTAADGAARKVWASGGRPTHNIPCKGDDRPPDFLESDNQRHSLCAPEPTAPAEGTRLQASSFMSLCLLLNLKYLLLYLQLQLYAPLFPVPHTLLSACINGCGLSFPALLSTFLHPYLPIYEGAYSNHHSASPENRLKVNLSWNSL